MTYASGNRYFALGKIELSCFGLWEHKKLTKYADYVTEIILPCAVQQPYHIDRISVKSVVYNIYYIYWHIMVF